MSLRAFHVLFITLSVLLALGCAGLALRDYFDSGSALRLAFGVAALLVAGGLVMYEIYFLKKTRRLIL